MANLQLGLTWQLDLEGKRYDQSFTSVIQGIDQASQRDILVPLAAQVDLIKVAAAVGAGTFSAIKGIILINTDSVNGIRIRVAKSGADTVDIELEPQTFTALWNTNISTAGGAFGAFVAWDEVNAQATTADANLTMLIVE